MMRYALQSAVTAGPVSGRSGPRSADLFLVNARNWSLPSCRVRPCPRWDPYGWKRGVGPDRSRPRCPLGALGTAAELGGTPAAAHLLLAPLPPLVALLFPHARASLHM